MNIITVPGDPRCLFGGMQVTMPEDPQRPAQYLQTAEHGGHYVISLDSHQLQHLSSPPSINLSDDATENLLTMWVAQQLQLEPRGAYLRRNTSGTGWLFCAIKGVAVLSNRAFNNVRIPESYSNAEETDDNRRRILGHVTLHLLHGDAVALAWAEDNPTTKPRPRRRPASTGPRTA